MARPAGGYKIDGKPVPGVTTVIGRFKDSGGLIYWAFEQGKACERGEINGLYDKRDDAATVGTAIHGMIQDFLDLTHSDPCKDLTPEQVKQANVGYHAFLDWTHQSNTEVMSYEDALLSKKHLFAGTPDALARRDGKLVVIDWKSSSGIYGDTIVQVAAYALLLEETFGEVVDEADILRFDKLTGDFLHKHVHGLDSAKRQFLLFREAYDIAKELARRAK